jgi:hypothetical protein
MTHARALGLAGILGLLTTLVACGSDEQSAQGLDAAGTGRFGPAETMAPTASRDEASGENLHADSEAPAGTSLGSAGEATTGGTSTSGAPAPPVDINIATEEPPATTPQPQVEPGTLTAGAWDDNRNITRFLEYRDRLHRQQMQGLLDFTPEEHTAAQVRTQPAAHTTLDISLVVDTTGSMGDEISYLQAEFLAISSTIEASYPNAEQRWSLVAYRDRGDAYTVRPFDFETNPELFRQHLAQQEAGGGGDIPEAPDAAFEAMNQLAWRSGSATARLAFWVADAPHHDDKAPALKAAIEAAEANGIHIYPVASSGINELTELTMRSAAQLTGGRYLFLTDDSGVGGAHKEPSIPCYFVTKLDSAILRMVDIEMTGVYREPTSAELIRAGGNPQSGACTLESGQTVYVF